MTEAQLQQHISIDPEICHGRPIIRGLRYTVEGILEYLAGGDSVDDLLSHFPDLTRQDILACLAYAKACVSNNGVVVSPVAA